MNKKLTTVTISFRGVKLQKFVMAEVGNGGRAYVSAKFIDNCAKELGARRGDTFTIG